MPKVNNLLHQKIEDYLMDLIKKGGLENGHCLPPESEIGKKFGASRYPVRQALQRLEDKGLLERRPGRGTFIRRPIFAPGSTNTIGVLYWADDKSFFSSSFYSTIYAGINTQAAAHGKFLVGRSLSKLEVADPVAVVTALEKEVDGFIFAGLTDALYQEIQPTMLTLNKPAVVLVYPDVPPSVDSILMDNRTDAMTMMEFLVEGGHRRIACLYHLGLREKRVGTNIQERVDTYLAVLKAHQLPADENLQLLYTNDDRFLPLDDTPLFRQFKDLMESPQPPTAIFCSNDDMAFKVYAMGYKLGLAIPDDLTVVGSGDTPEAALAKPPLTTTHIPMTEMGETAMKRLVEKIEEARQGRRSHQRIALSGWLVKRESHKKIQAEK